LLALPFAIKPGMLEMNDSRVRLEVIAEFFATRASSDGIALSRAL
jgi:hypothetical protein